jgi:hypothetical protein
LTAYQLSEVDRETSIGKPEIATPVTKELEAMTNNGTAGGTTLNGEPPAPSSVGIVGASGLHYVRVFDNGAKHELIGPFRTRDQAQPEVAKWIARFKSVLQQ